MGSVYNMFYKIQLLFIGAALAAPSSDNGEKKFPTMTPEAAASCDPDYGWINGPEGTNKCYMILKETEITNCGLGNGGGGGGVCSPDYYNCYAECTYKWYAEKKERQERKPKARATAAASDGGRADEDDGADLGDEDVVPERRSEAASENAGNLNNGGDVD